MRILVAEDSSPTASILKRSLERDGHVVTVASTASAAKDALIEGPFDVVIADFGLGGGETGLDVLAFCLANFPDAARILTSGLMRAGDLRAADWFLFLPKPYRRQQLRDAIETVARKET